MKKNIMETTEVFTKKSVEILMEEIANSEGVAKVTVVYEDGVKITKRLI